MMERKMQEVAPVHSERNTMSLPPCDGTWLVLAVVVLTVPVGWQWQVGLSDILVAAEHPAERWV